MSKTEVYGRNAGGSEKILREMEWEARRWMRMECGPSAGV